MRYVICAIGALCIRYVVDLVVLWTPSEFSFWVKIILDALILGGLIYALYTINEKCDFLESRVKALEKANFGDNSEKAGTEPETEAGEAKAPETPETTEDQTAVLKEEIEAYESRSI